MKIVVMMTIEEKLKKFKLNQSQLIFKI